MKYQSSILLLLFLSLFDSIGGWLYSTTTTFYPNRIRRTTTTIIRRFQSYAIHPKRISTEEVNNNNTLKKKTITNKKKKSITPTITTTTTKTTTTTTTSTALFWYNTTDPFVIHYQNDTVIGLQFRIRGNPLPLQRHRQTRRGLVYNPSSTAQEMFRKVLQTQLEHYYYHHSDDSLRPSTTTTSTKTLLGNAPIHMSCQFYLKRSLSDFVANTRGRPLKVSKQSTKQQQQQEWWSSTTTTRTPDVDNLAKFVLDSFNGLLYEDDQQIVSLAVVKLRDSYGDCLGYTDIQLSILSSSSSDHPTN